MVQGHIQKTQTFLVVQGQVQESQCLLVVEDIGVIVVEGHLEESLLVLQGQVHETHSLPVVQDVSHGYVCVTCLYQLEMHVIKECPEQNATGRYA